MDYFQLMISIGIIGVTMYVIKYACDSFGDASEHLGKKVYKMKPGVRGATIEAVASSLPELFTTTFLLFVFNDLDGFSAGIATCAGSAVFNAAVIPGICILAVTIKGVKGKPVARVSLRRSTILRDGLFFLLAEIALIYFLGNTALTWWMGAALIGIYIIYFGYLMRSFSNGNNENFEEEEEDEEEEDVGDEGKGFIGKLVTFDFNELIFGGREFTVGSAWVVLLCATALIAGTCYYLAEAVIMSAKALGVPAYFTAVIFGAAATSVPDTFISYNNAMKGDYDDAVSNAVGSNIFDICVALGLPLMAYGLIFGDVNLAGVDGGSANVQELRIALIIITLLILGLFLINKTTENEDGETLLNVGKDRGWILSSIYIIWTLFIIGRASEWQWLQSVLS